MKYIKCLASVAICSAHTANSATAQNSESTPPNIVIFISDDVSYNDLECYGSQNTSTPNLNELVNEGMQFTNCFLSTAMSSPTRHSLYTGLYPIRSGAYPNHTYVKDDVKSYVQYFRDNGYRTALYGKEHVSPRSVFCYDYLGDYKKGDMDFGAIKDYISTSTDPFFMVVASREAHGPYDCGDPSKWKLDELVLPPFFVDTPATRWVYRKYLAEIEVMDNQVGVIRETLKDMDCADNTIFIFLSEQGNAFPFAKWTCYSQGLRSAMVVSYPRAVKPSTQSDALVEYVDILPTLMDFAAINYNPEDLDGVSFIDLLQGKKREHKENVFGIHTNMGVNDGTLLYGIRSVSNKRYRYIKNLLPDSTYRNSIQNTTWWAEWVSQANSGDEFAIKQIDRYEHRTNEELYDLRDDPYEMNNIASQAKYKSVIKEMRNDLEKWMIEQGDKGIESEIEALYRLVPGVRKKYENNNFYKK